MRRARWRDRPARSPRRRACRPRRGRARTPVAASRVRRVAGRPGPVAVRSRPAERLARRLVARAVGDPLRARALVAHRRPCPVAARPARELDQDLLPARLADGADPVAGDAEGERAVAVGRVPHTLGVRQPHTVGAGVAVGVPHGRRDDPRRPRIRGCRRGRGDGWAVA